MPSNWLDMHAWFRKARMRSLAGDFAMAVSLLLLPWVFSAFGGTVDMVSRILIWGLFGIGFDILLGYTGILSFGQAAFYGTGGFTASYLLAGPLGENALLALLAGIAVASVAGLFIGVLSVRRSGIYFAMLTVAFAQLFYFLENSVLSAWTGGENGLSGVPKPVITLGFTTVHVQTAIGMYGFIAILFFASFLFARRLVASPFGAVLRAIRENPNRAAAVGHDVAKYKIAAFIIAAGLSGLAGGLLGLLQGYMPPDAFSLDTSGQLVIQSVVGGIGTLIGPLIGAAVWSVLSVLLQAVPGLGPIWKFGLGIFFILVITFLRRGFWGGALFAWNKILPHQRTPLLPAVPGEVTSAGHKTVAQRKCSVLKRPLLLEAHHLTKRFGGLTAVDDVSMSVAQGELRALIGPNGAGKSTFFKMLAGQIRPTQGDILFQGRRITSLSDHRICQLGIAKSHQIVQLFPGLSVRDNLLIPILAREQGSFRLNMLSNLGGIASLGEQVDEIITSLQLKDRAEALIDALAYGEKRRLEIGLAVATQPELLLLDEPMAGMSPAERGDVVHLIRDIAASTTIIIVEHDMDVVFELAESITVLSEGRKIAEGSPEAIQQNEAVQTAYLGVRIEHEFA